MDDAAIDNFWRVASRRAKIANLPGYFGPGTLEVVTPPAWSFGADPEQADRLLALVLDGTKTATASAREDYDLEEEPLPTVGTMGILLDGRGRPRALVSVTAVSVTPFDEVDEEHARAEGEGDRTLASWRADHEAFFRANDPRGRGFRPDMPVVLERFEVLYQADARDPQSPSTGSGNAPRAQPAYEPVRISSSSRGPVGVQPRPRA